MHNSTYSYENEKRRTGLFFRNCDAVNIAIAFFLVYTTIYTSFSGINSTITLIVKICNVLMYLLVLNALPVVLRSFTKGVVMFSFGLILIYSISLIAANNSVLHSQVLSTFFRYCLPALLLAFSIRDFEDLFQKLKISALVIIISQCISIFFLSSNQIFTLAYSQDTGYETLLAFSVFFVASLTKKKRIYWIGVFVSFVLILMSGARGPLFCALAGAALIIITIQKSSYKVIIALTGSCVLAYLFYVPILNLLFGVFESIGASTRVIRGLLEFNISNDSTRATLMQFSWNYATDHIFWGTGLANDRELIYNTLFLGNSASVFGSYCHNFLLEILMQFGLIPGIIVLTLFFSRLISMLFKEINFEKRMIVVVFVTIGFLPLIFSRSYLTFPEFYFLLGVLFTSINKGRDYINLIQQ